MHRLSLLVLLVAACGDDGVRHTPDAAPHDSALHDGSPDAPGDAPFAPVTLTASVDGTGVAGVQVYFQNADSTVVLATTTDATGTASAVMQAGGYVTAVKPYTPPAFGGTPSDEIDTFSGVKPGDHLVLNLPITSTAITVTVTADADPAATSLTVFTPCGAQQLAQAGSGVAPTATFSLTNCGTATDFLVVSYDQNSQPLDMFAALAKPIADGATIDLTGTAYAAVPTRTFTYTDPPANVESFSFDDNERDAQGAVFGFSGFAGSGGATYPVPTFTNAVSAVIATFFPGGPNEEVLADWGPFAPTYTTDVLARELPLFLGNPAFDPATHTLSFGEEAEGAPPDFVFTSVSAFRQSANHAWIWRIAAAHTTAVAYPVLPVDMFDYNITAGDSPSWQQLYTGKVPGGYDAVRAYLLTGGSFDPRGVIAGATGTATVQRYALLAKKSRTLRNRTH
jgi:hypothetical protein